MCGCGHNHDDKEKPISIKAILVIFAIAFIVAYEWSVK